MRDMLKMFKNKAILGYLIAFTLISVIGVETNHQEQYLYNEKNDAVIVYK